MQGETNIILYGPRLEVECLNSLAVIFFEIQAICMAARSREVSISISMATSSESGVVSISILDSGEASMVRRVSSGVRVRRAAFGERQVGAAVCGFRRAGSRSVRHARRNQYNSLWSVARD